jgi:hypothetical protein
MEKMIMVKKRYGWDVWPTPYWFRIRSQRMTKRWEFKGTRYAHNRRRRHLPRS